MTPHTTLLQLYTFFFLPIFNLLCNKSFVINIINVTLTFTVILFLSFGSYVKVRRPVTEQR